MKATVGDKEGGAASSGIDEPIYVWEQVLGTGYVKFATRLHEVFLRVYTPQDGVWGSHAFARIVPEPEPEFYF